ncbi:MAG: 30S ribosomal protein S11 [Candidatus Kerfeldbacteria bacterium]|nr:30S ribosomal protein S11 [Candidatus Kerfeldbacteria bacterium]
MAEEPKKRKKKARRAVSQGQVHIQSSYNNTIVSITDLQGNVLGWSSAGHLGFKGPKKATPYAASRVVRDLVEKLSDVGLKEVEVYVTGVGGGRESAVHALSGQGLSISKIKDLTPIPHNGPRPKRPRRI